MNLKKDYFYYAARDNGISLKEYFECLDRNFVIIDNGTPVVWENSHCPVIFGDIADAKSEMLQWCGNITNVSIITEKEFIGRYCFDEYTKAIKEMVEESDPTIKAYDLYLKGGGDATLDQFKIAIEKGGLDPADYGYGDEDTIVAEVSGAFADIFIANDKNFKEWMDTLDVDKRYDAYGEVLEMTPSMVLSYCAKANANEYYERVNAIRKKYSTYEEVMDTLNGHNEELVAKINDAWNKSKESFKYILIALYERDIDEITDADSFHITKWVGSWQWNEGVRNDNWKPYMDMALEDMKERWSEFADNYLEHIADDADLEAILNFLHYPHLPIWK